MHAKNLMGFQNRVRAGRAMLEARNRVGAEKTGKKGLAYGMRFFHVRSSRGRGGGGKQRRRDRKRKKRAKESRLWLHQQWGTRRSAREREKNTGRRIKREARLIEKLIEKKDEAHLFSSSARTTKEQQ